MDLRYEIPIALYHVPDQDFQMPLACDIGHFSRGSSPAVVT